jgi:hypothetical protein
MRSAVDSEAARMAEEDIAQRKVDFERRRLETLNAERRALFGRTASADTISVVTDAAAEVERILGRMK